MKIVYIDMLYDYGQKKRGLSPIGQYGFVRNFERLGHDVVPFYYDDYLTLDQYGTLQTDLKTFVDQHQPDLVWHATYTDQLTLDTLLYLKNRFVTVAWFGDDTWRFDSFTRHYAPYYSYCITTDKYAIADYHRIGQPNVILSQWAAIDSYKTKAVQSPYVYDVSFIGAHDMHREWFIDRLGVAGISVETFGHGWPNGAVSMDDMSDIFSQSRINLNLSNSVPIDYRYWTCGMSRDRVSFLKRYNMLQRFYSSFCKPLSPKTAEQIKARNFEIPFFNGFQLTPYVVGLEDYFDIGRDVACFTSIDDAVLTISYYLAHDDQRERIKASGHRRAVADHGYQNRIRAILDNFINR